MKFKLPFGGEIIFVLKIAKMEGIRHFRSSTVDPDSGADYASLLRPSALRHCRITLLLLLVLRSCFDPFCVSLRLIALRICVTAGSGATLDFLFTLQSKDNIY